ncbi:hypothetical protein GCM10022222_23060 [Amycolatopsis ultiminotia]|uniref:Uncharacterized protein n=1 Tax=Amycolatopsis ultiminotia TaxID=543629 RepID=A0ABP6VU45_9PSEU
MRLRSGAAWSAGRTVPVRPVDRHRPVCSPVSPVVPFQLCPGSSPRPASGFETSGCGGPYAVRPKNFFVRPSPQGKTLGVAFWFIRGETNSGGVRLVRLTWAVLASVASDDSADP